MPGRTVDESFLALPLSALTDAALTRAVDLGCEHADIRVERIRTQTISLRDARLESLTDGEDLGLSVRVVLEGTWGFAAGVVLTAAEAVRLAEEAVAVAQVSAAINSDRVGLAPEPTYDGEWVSDYDVDPFEVPDADKTGLLTELSERLLAADGVEHVQSSCMHVKEQKYYADTSGTRTRQQRVRIHPEITALTVDRATGSFESMRTLAPPVGRRWGHLTRTGWDGGPRLGVPHRHRLGRARRARRDPRAAAGEDQGAVGRARPLRPGDRPVEPVPHHPRVRRARHRARPGARLRGGLRRHVVRHGRQARDAAVRLAADERHRRP